MGILTLFSKPVAQPPLLDTLPEGSFAVNRGGKIVACTLGSSLPKPVLAQISQTVLSAFTRAHEVQLPLSELETSLGGIKIVARELRGGALIFLHPESPLRPKTPRLAMSHSNLKEFVLYLETYVECWKQFNHYLDLSRTGKYTAEDETQFLEVKSLITQGLEVILAAIDQGAPRKDEVMALINGAPSIRFLSEHENNIFAVESQWHKLFLILQSLLGRLKVLQQKQDGEWHWSSLFKRVK